MNRENVHSAPPTAESGSLEMLRALVGLGILCALLIVLTYEGTLPRIERLKAEALQQAIFKVLPGITSSVAFQLEGDQFVASPDDATGQLVYAGYDANDQLVGLAIEASGQGYADVIRILYGYSPGKEALVGFHVLESKETPGLGDKIEKDANFLRNFQELEVRLGDDGKTILNNVTTVKQGTKENPWEVDGITGATISSRAIGDILDLSTQYWVPLIRENEEVFINHGKRQANDTAGTR